MTLPAPAVNPHLPPLLLSIVRTDRRTEGRTLDRLMAFTAYYTEHRCKNVFFLFWSRFYFFNVFLFSKRVFILKKRWQSSEQHAN